MFSWFANRSAIKDLMGPLRAVAKAEVRFYWSPKLEASFRAVLSAILDPITSCLRPPIEPSSETPYCLFTDASKSQIGGVLTQIQEAGNGEIDRDGLKEGAKRIYDSVLFERDAESA